MEVNHTMVTEGLFSDTDLSWSLPLLIMFGGIDVVFLAYRAGSVL